MLIITIKKITMKNLIKTLGYWVIVFVCCFVILIKLIKEKL